MRILVTLDALAPLVASLRTGAQTPTTIEHLILTSLAEYTPQAAGPPTIEGTIAFTDLLTADRIAIRSRSDRTTSRSCNTPAARPGRRKARC
jgi:hypothetical protein